MRSSRNSIILSSVLFIGLSLSGRAQTHTWTGADPSGYWSAPANWSPAGVPVNGNDLVLPGGLPPGDMVSTNDLTDSFFRSITFGQASRHTISGNPITLTNRADCIINSGTNVIACDLTFSGTPPNPTFEAYAINQLAGGSFTPTPELTVLGNVGSGGKLYSFFGRLVIRGQFTGGSLRQYGGSMTLHGDNPYAVSAEVQNGTLLVQGSQPNLNITMLWEMESGACPHLSGDGVVGDVTGCGHLTLDSTLSVKNISRGVCATCYYNTLTIRLNGTNVGEYGRLVASGDVSLSSGRLLPSAGFNPQPGQIYTIVEKTSPGPIASAFLGPEGTVTNLNGMPFRISYVGGDGNDVTLTVETNARPTVTITNPPNAAVFTAPANFSLAASASDPDGSVTNVQFFRDATSLGNDSSSPYSTSVSGLAAGNYTLSAVASDNRGLRATNSVVVTVAGPPPTTNTWTGADPSGNWSAPSNWSPAGVPVNGADLVFPGGLPPGDMVSTNDLTGSIFRSIRFDQAGGHTIRGNPITLTNRSDCIINSGTNVIACDLTFTGTPPTPQLQDATIRDSGSGELTVIGNVGGGSLSFHRQQFGTQPRWVIMGQFTGGSLRVGYGTLALYGDNPHAISAVVDHSTLLVQGSQPNLNVRMFSIPPKTLLSSYMRGEGQVGDVTEGTGYLILDSTLAARNVTTTYLNINLHGTNVGQYGRLVASGDVSPYGGFLSASAGFNARAGQIFTIVDKTSPGPVGSAFFGPEGSVTTLNGRPFRISYVGGDGNDVTLTAQPSDSDPTFGDANWSPLGSGTSPFLYVYALAVSGDDLYAGSGSTVEKWDGTNWSTIGSVFYPPDFKATAEVNALVVSGGDLYAGGRFTKANGNPATNIAKWNGSTWSALGSGLSGGAYPFVTALAVSGNDLYAGGGFRMAGETPVNSIAKCNGTNWSALGSGIGGSVYALAVSGSNLYAGGQFTTAGGSPAGNIAKWDGSTWSVLGSGMGGPVYALAVSGPELYAGGFFSTAGGNPASRTAKWGGSAWSALGTGVANQFGQGSVRTLAVLGNDLYAGGEFTTAGANPANFIAKWDGSAWSALGSGMNNSVRALAVLGNHLYAGGFFTTAGNKPSAYIAKARIASAAESITASGSSATIQFSGVVGYQYHVQRTTSLTPSMAWTTLTTTPLSPAADGSFSFIDTTAPPGPAYYRLMQD